MAINKNRATQKAKPVILVVDDQPQDIELLEAYLFRWVMKLLKRQTEKKHWGNFQ